MRDKQLLNSKYLVVDCECLESFLDDTELEKFYELLDKATRNQEEQDFYVFKGKDIEKEAQLRVTLENKQKLKKQEALSKLQELSELEDGEIAHIEAIEVLLDYIDDRDIDDAYSHVPLWF